MRFRRGWILALLLSTAASTWMRAARADDAANDEVIVVDVAPGAAGLDADALRAAIASELHARAVAPGDPSAPSAKGTLTVDVDRARRELAVTYVAREAPIARRVPLPADGAAARRAAVALAGNLARDEAGELADEMRTQRPESAQSAAAQRDAAEEAWEREAHDAARLRATLEYHAGVARRGSSIVWASIGGTTAAGSVAVTLVDPPWPWAIGATLSVLPLPLQLANSQYTPSKTFEELVARTEKGESSEATEQAWHSAAQRERTTRTALGVAGVVVGVLSQGAGVVALMDGDLERSDRQRIGAFLLSAGVLDIVGSIYGLTTAGPVEVAWNAYEQTTGRAVPTPTTASLPHLSISPVPGGAVGTIGGTF